MPSFDHCAALSGQRPVHQLSSCPRPVLISPFTSQTLRWAQFELVLLIAGFLKGSRGKKRPNGMIRNLAHKKKDTGPTFCA